LSELDLQFIIPFFICRSYIFQHQHVILRELSLDTF